MNSQVIMNWCKSIVAVWFLGLGLMTSAHADWRNDVGIFRIGIVSEGETSSYFLKIEPFRLALIEALQIEVEFYAAPNAITIIDAFNSERIEYAIMPAAAYALAWVTCECVEPLVVPKAADSTDGYYTLVLSRPGGPQSLDELQNSKLGLLSFDSLTGAKFPLKLLAEQGVMIRDANLVPSNSAADAIASFTAGETDALIGWSSLNGEPGYGYSRGTLSQIAQANKGDVSGYQIIWQSPQIPHQPHVIRRKLNGEAKQILRETLLDLFEKDPVVYDAIEPIFGGGFAETRQLRFTPLIKFMDELYPKAKILGEDASVVDNKSDAITSQIDKNKK